MMGMWLCVHWLGEGKPSYEKGHRQLCHPFAGIVVYCRGPNAKRLPRHFAKGNGDMFGVYWGWVNAG